MSFDLTLSPPTSWSTPGESLACPYRHARCLMCRCGHWEHAHEGGTLCADCGCDAVRRSDRAKGPA